MTDIKEYLIRKSGAWYRPNSAGYTNNIAEAGRYTMAEAEAITHPNGPDGPRDHMSYELAPPSPAPAESGAVAWDFVSAAEAIGLYCGDESDEVADTDPMEAAFDAFIAEHPLPYVEGKSPRVALAAAINAYLAPARTVITETERLLASPAPSASMGRVTVKALEWSSEAPYGVARVPKLGLMYSTEAIWYEGIFEHVELLGSASGRFPTVASARAAAQADYEARILAALDSPPDHGGGEGWVLVPREPTEAMLDAGLGPILFGTPVMALLCYRAMIAAAPSADAGVDLLAAMAKHLGWELDWGPREPNDEEGEYGWRVHDRRGNRSDLEWTLIGFGASPADALRAALRSQP